jgi:hypothetical protein
MEFMTSLLSPILPLLLSSLFYGVLITAGIFIILVIRKFNLQDQVKNLVAAAEIIFPGEKTGEDKKAWVVQEIQKVYPKLDAEILNKLIERFVYEIKQ